MTTSIIYNNSVIATLTEQSSTLLTSGKALNHNINIIHDTPQGYDIDSIATRAYPSEIVGYNASYISSSIFYSCDTITAASFPNVTSIGAYAFGYCSQLESISFPNCSYVGPFAFFSCSALTSIEFPNCTSAMSSAFRYCSGLTSVSFPNLERTDAHAFTYCGALSSVYFPKLESLGYAAFGSCYSLQTVRLPVCNFIDQLAFTRCRNLLSLYLDEVTSVPSLSSSTAFSSTPIGGYTESTSGVYGSIFVPASLVSDFKAATNWSLFSDRIVGISDSSSSSTSIPDTLVAKFVKRWYDTGSTASCTEANHYNTLPALPLVLGNPVTHLTYQIITDSAFSAQINGTTSPMGEGPHIYLSSAAPTDIDYMGTCIYSHADDGMDWTNVSEAFSVAAGNNGNYLTVHTWCDDWDNDMCTLATINVSSYSGEYYLLKK